MELPEEQLNLAIAKLVVDKIVDPSININLYLSKLDSMIIGINKILGPRTKSMDKMLAIKTYLFDAGKWNKQQPYVYDLDDPLGRKIENKLLPNFIKTKKGNCVSMPFLFLILGKKMGINVVASTAPLHIFVRFKDDLTGDVWNIETTNGGNPSRNIWYIRQFQIPEDAVRNGVYLRDLTNKETIAVMLMEVEQFYTDNKEYEKSLEICDLALNYYPNYAYALARKGNAYACILNRDVRDKGYSKENPLPKEKEEYYKSIFEKNMQCFAKAESLGWRDIGKEFDEKYLQMVKEEQKKLKAIKMRPVIIFTLFVLLATTLFAQDDWDNWKPYSSESYYDVKIDLKEKAESEDYNIYNPKFYVTKMQNRFLTVDRFAHKYPSMSPYHYAANNPVRFIDVNGDSLWINYSDSDGNSQRMLYTQGMEYSGSNKQVAAFIGSLNSLNSLSGGNTVLSSLTGSTANYNVNFANMAGGKYTPNEVQQGSGGNILLGNPSSVSGVAHEMFHAYQHENMIMINSTAFEVGAHLFENSVYSQMNQGTFTLPYGGSEAFNAAYSNLMVNPNFNQQDFNAATRTFKQNQYNAFGDYNKLNPTIINNPLIKRFYPLIR